MSRLHICSNCQRYTLRQAQCPYCGAPVRSPHPPKYSPHDRMAKYRRMWKRILMKEEGATSS